MDPRPPFELRYARPKYQEPGLVKRGLEEFAALLLPVALAVLCLCLGAVISFTFCYFFLA